MDTDTAVHLYNSLQLADIQRLLERCPESHRPRAKITGRVKWNKGELIQLLLSEGSYWADQLSRTATNKNDESLQKQLERQNRTVEHTSALRHEHPEAQLTTGFLVPPSESDYMRSYIGIHAATSNAALKELVCAVCARTLNVVEAKITTMSLTDLPSRERLRPSVSHPAHVLLDGCLLEPKGCSQIGQDIKVNMCHECLEDLKEESLDPPKLLLANNLWIGPTPWHLERLTIAELLLTALVFPRVFIIKLFPRNKSRYGLSNDQLQNALRGNVTTFELNPKAIASMIKGNLMPQRPSILASVLLVTFIGRGKIPNPASLPIFRVRRNFVAEGLMWLKVNNPKYYGSIVIDPARLAELPVDNIPLAITANIRCEEDDSMIDAELNGHVPDAYINDNTESEALAPTGCSNKSSSDDATVITLQFLGVMDNDLSKLTSNELMNWGLQNLQRQNDNLQQEPAYAVRYGAPVNTFGQPPKGKGPADPNRRIFWEAAFPGLYPFGVGGIESDRPVQVSFTEHVRWSLQYHDRRFRYHSTFIFTAFGIQQRRQALISARIQMKRRDFDSAAQTLSSITLDGLRRAAEEEKSGHVTVNPAIDLLREYIGATSKRVMGSGPARIQLRSQISSAAMYFNQPTVWLTINPDDLHNPIAQIFAGEEIDMDEFAKTAGPDKLRRSQNVARDPFAAAKFFHYTIMLVLENCLALHQQTLAFTRKPVC